VPKIERSVNGSTLLLLSTLQPRLQKARWCSLYPFVALPVYVYQYQRMCNLGAACIGELARFRRDPAFVICARVILPYKKSSAGSTNEVGVRTWLLKELLDVSLTVSVLCAVLIQSQLQLTIANPEPAILCGSLLGTTSELCTKIGTFGPSTSLDIYK
jgi:hypothetical protein